MAFARETVFWKVMFLSGLFGCVIGVCGLVFMNFADEVPKKWIDNGDFDEASDCDYYAGQKYWIIVTTATGFFVGFVRWFFMYPENMAGLFKEINECHVEPSWAPVTCLISMISISGGASLGPEQALGNLGGGIATFISDYLKVEEDDRKLVVLSGMTAAMGALFPSPMLGVLMMYELGNPPKTYMESIIVLSFSGILSFVIMYVLSEKTYLEHIKPDLLLAYTWEFSEWQCGTGFIVGVISGATSLVCVFFIGICKQVFLRMRARLGTRSKFLATVVPPTLGGLFIGLVNWALPLTVSNGSLVLQPIIKFGYSKAISTNLLLCSLFAKMFVLGVSMNCGFIGGFIFPQLAIGTMCGIVMHQMYDYVPIGLCISCFIAGVPAGICPMPFTLACLVIFIFNFGLYQTAPIFITTITSYTIVCGSGIFGALASRNQQSSIQEKNPSTDGSAKPSADEIKQRAAEKMENDKFAIAQYLGAKKAMQPPIDNLNSP